MQRVGEAVDLGFVEHAISVCKDCQQLVDCHGCIVALGWRVRSDRVNPLGMRFARDATITAVDRSWFDQFSGAAFDRLTAAGIRPGRQTFPPGSAVDARDINVLSWSRTGDTRVDVDTAGASGMALSDTLLRTPEHPRQLVAAGSFEGAGRAQRFSTRWTASVDFDRWWEGEDDAALADVQVKYARIKVVVRRTDDRDDIWQVSVRAHVRFVWWCKPFALVAMPFHGRLQAEFAKAVNELVAGWNKEVPDMIRAAPADAAAKVVGDMLRPEPRKPESA